MPTEWHALPLAALMFCCSFFLFPRPSFRLICLLCSPITWGLLPYSALCPPPLRINLSLAHSPTVPQSISSPLPPHTLSVSSPFSPLHPIHLSSTPLHPLHLDLSLVHPLPFRGPYRVKAGILSLGTVSWGVAPMPSVQSVSAGTPTQTVTTRGLGRSTEMLAKCPVFSGALHPSLNCILKIYL